MTKIKIEFNQSEAPLMADILAALMNCVQSQNLTDNFIEFMIVKTIKKLYHAHFTQLNFLEKQTYSMRLEPEHAACLAAATQVYFDEMSALHEDHRLMIQAFNAHIHRRLI